MIIPAAPPTTAPRMAPFAVDPFALPMAPPAMAPPVAPMIPAFSLLLSEAQPPSAREAPTRTAIDLWIRTRLKIIYDCSAEVGAPPRLTARQAASWIYTVWGIECLRRRLTDTEHKHVVGHQRLRLLVRCRLQPVELCWMATTHPSQSPVLELLSDIGIQRELGALPGWARRGASLTKTYRFPTFPGAITFVTRVADVAETMNHH